MKNNWKKRLLAILLSVTLLLPATGFAVTRELPEAAYDETTLLVKLAHREISLFAVEEPLFGCMELEYLYTAAGSDTEASRRSKSRAASSAGDWYEMKLEPGIDPVTAAQNLEDDPRVLDTMLNYELTLYDDFVSGWESKTQWNLNEAGLPQARAYLEAQGFAPGGSEDIIVAVLDTGVDYEHPELKDCIWRNPNETENGLDDDENGFVDDIRGWNFGDKGNNANDPMDTASPSHGTMCAGVIAAANNGSQVTGVSFGVKIMPVKVVGQTGNVSTLVSGIKYACENGADIVSMSTGFALSNTYSTAKLSTLVEIINTYKDEVLFVAAAGNKDTTETAAAIQTDRAWPNALAPGYTNYCVTYPAALDGVVGVMSYDKTADSNGDRLAKSSRWDPYPGQAPEYDLIAPGVSILTTSYDRSADKHGYVIGSGTSFATPFVSGLAALLKTYYQGTACESPAMLRRLLQETASTMQGYTNTNASPAIVMSYPAPDVLAAMTYTTTDLDGDGAQGGSDGDLQCLHDVMYTAKGDAGYLPIADYNNDGVINVKDQVQFIRNCQIENR